MLKKILCWATLLSACSATIAEPVFYVGPTIYENTTTLNYASTRQVTPVISAGVGTNAWRGQSPQYYYIGGEIFAGPSSVLVQNHRQNSPISTRNTTNVGLSLIPGVRTSENTMLFLRLGVVGTHFTSTNDNIAGAHIGVGIQTSLSFNWDIRGEYVYTAYRSITGYGAPRSDWFGIGWIYKYG